MSSGRFSIPSSACNRQDFLISHDSLKHVWSQTHGVNISVASTTVYFHGPLLLMAKIKKTLRPTIGLRTAARRFCLSCHFRSYGAVPD